ncbi:Fic family protein [Kitasatospora sp. NPDC093550]|uniref:Fic family protein n=1 Tax=Kitasatospora sp. NPDC093550 TaxID=3364089 RepID=UPI00380A76B1
MIANLSPRLLRWNDVDPVRHPFDRASAAREIRGLGPALRVPSSSDAPADEEGRNAWEWNVAGPWAAAMSYALAEHYGGWVAGWRWAIGEGDYDGGPIGSWCCPPHSVGTPEETVERVIAAVCEWRAWLEDLACRFEEHPLDAAAVEEQRSRWERAARSLILQVAERTRGDSGWYGHCEQVLVWFLDRWGVAPEAAEGLVREAIGGRFRSWISPDTELVGAVAEQLAQSLRPGHARGGPPAEPLPDHLERWLAVRRDVVWPEPSAGAGHGPVTPSRDGAAEDVRAFDGAIDVARADGLLAALDLLRADAARGAVLDVELLSGWQQHVLDTPQPPAFRTLPAFAKGGAERYGIGPDTRARFDACLAESAGSDGTTLSLSARAARAYLDVCFFHPFEDGNARAAFLALLFVLAREGVGLDDVNLLRRVTFQADDPRDPPILVRYIDLHLAETRSNAAARDS